MQADLPGIVAEVEARGRRHLVVNGAMRLPCWFVVGSAFSRVADWEVTCGRATQQWSSADEADSSVRLEHHEEEVGNGDDLALAIALTADPTVQITRYLARSGLPVKRLVTLQPVGNPHDQLIASGADAVSIAQQVQQQARALVDEGEHPRVHLFLAAPAGAALLIGHRWNRIARTVVYEDLGAVEGYATAFEVGAWPEAADIGAPETSWHRTCLTDFDIDDDDLCCLIIVIRALTRPGPANPEASRADDVDS
jgi:hypothetical protein